MFLHDAHSKTLVNIQLSEKLNDSNLLFHKYDLTFIQNITENFEKFRMSKQQRLQTPQKLFQLANSRLTTCQKGRGKSIQKEKLPQK